MMGFFSLPSDESIARMGNFFREPTGAEATPEDPTAVPDHAGVPGHRRRPRTRLIATGAGPLGGEPRATAGAAEGWRHAVGPPGEILAS